MSATASSTSDAGEVTFTSASGLPRLTDTPKSPLYIPIDIHRHILTDLPPVSLANRSTLISYACTNKSLATIVLPKLYEHVQLGMSTRSLGSFLRAGLDACVLDIAGHKEGVKRSDPAKAEERVEGWAEEKGKGRDQGQVKGKGKHVGEEDRGSLKAALLRSIKSLTLVPYPEGHGYKASSEIPAEPESPSSAQATGIERREPIPNQSDKEYLAAVRHFTLSHGRLISPLDRLEVSTIIYQMPLPGPRVEPRNKVSHGPGVPYTIPPPPTTSTSTAAATANTNMPPPPTVPGQGMPYEPAQPNIPWSSLPLAVHAALAHLLCAFTSTTSIGPNSDSRRHRRLIISGLSLHTTDPIPWLVYRLVPLVDEVVLWIKKSPAILDVNNGPGSYATSIARVFSDRIGLVRVFDQIHLSVSERYGFLTTPDPVMMYPTSSSARTKKRDRRAPLMTLVLALDPNERYDPPGPPYSSMPMTMEFHPDYAPGWLHGLCKVWATPFAKILLSHARRGGGEEGGDEESDDGVYGQGEAGPALFPANTIIAPPSSQHLIPAPNDGDIAAAPNSANGVPDLAAIFNALSSNSPAPAPAPTPTWRPQPLIRLINFGALSGNPLGLPQASPLEIQDRLSRGLKVCVHRAMHWSRHEMDVGLEEDTRGKDARLVAGVELGEMGDWLKEEGREQGSAGVGMDSGNGVREEKDRWDWVERVDPALAAKSRQHLAPRTYR